MSSLQKTRKDRTAIIIAAGRGSRLLKNEDSANPVAHKSLIEVEGCTLLNTSIHKLLLLGFSEIIVVIGHRAESVVASVNKEFINNEVRFVENKDYMNYGNMVSILKGIQDVDNDCLILDADIIYEMKALSLILEAIDFNGFITTRKSGSGDEVLVESWNNTVTEITKFPKHSLIDGMSEYIGITAFNRKVLSHLRNLNAEDCGAIDYESYIDANLLRLFSFQELYLPDLVWIEVDSEADLQRLRSWSLNNLKRVTLK